jgi:endothelin-converting enzyme/putative endopeptidase
MSIAVAAFASLLLAQGFDPKSLNRTVAPCDDFYEHACSVWVKNNPIPPERSAWGRFNELDERNLAITKQILEQAAKAEANRSALDQQIGDFYYACMDETGINQRGIAPLQAELERIRAAKTKLELTPVITRLHRIGVGAFFHFGATPNLVDSTKMIAEVDQGGLGLPERDYYLRDDAKSVELRKQYLAHVIRNFELAGDSVEAAARKGKAVLEIETALAKGSLDIVTRRNPESQHHPYKVAELISLNPGFDWNKHFEGLGLAGLDTLNVTHPPFFRAFESVIVLHTLDDLKAYLSWHLIHETAGVLPTPFVDADFEFYGKALEGAKKMKDRWKRCADLVDTQLGDALGQRWVEKNFPPAAKDRMRRIVKAIEGALARDIDSLPWMSAATKQKALDKLRAIADKIGYPDKWKSYAAAKIARDDLYGNAIRLSELEYIRDLAKIGKPVDRTEWSMTAPTVNAYYDSQHNDINFPAGILQPPFFDNKLDDASNLGAIGAVIGHELTHGFDDSGRKFDGAGNLADWWTEKDGEEFERRVDCFVKQYSDYAAVPGVKLNGQLTLGENVADNGGVRVAYMALQTLMGAKAMREVRGGYTPEQRFFYSYAQVWCSQYTDEAARMRANVDPHSPGRYRVNGVLANSPEFRQAFGCKVGQPMVREPGCRVW